MATINIFVYFLQNFYVCACTHAPYMLNMVDAI